MAEKFSELHTATVVCRNRTDLKSLIGGTDSLTSLKDARRPSSSVFSPNFTKVARAFV